jgi:hypothetical protein
LHLIPHENYLTNRKITDIPSNEESFVITDMPNMIQFVYEFYAKKIEEWKRDRPQIFEQFVEQKSNEQTNETPVTNEENMIVEESIEEEMGFEKLTEDDEGLDDREDIHISDETNN